MGYYTSFDGAISIEPPLNDDEIEYLTKFANTRRMHRGKGPYDVGGGGFAGQAAEPDIIDYNRPPEGQPGLWCPWAPTSDGQWIDSPEDGKHYDAAEWMLYLIQHFLAPGALAKSELPFLQANHVLNGTIEAQGEDSSDRWDLVVEDNRVYVQRYEVLPGKREPVL